MALDTETLYRTYGPMVLRRCRQLLRNEESAADAMQEVFVKVLRKEKQLRSEYPSSLLYRIATTTCLNIIRSRSRRREDPDADMIDRIAGTDDVSDRYGVRDLLDRIFSREQPSTRAMAVMHLVDGMTHAEVAREFHLSVSGVRKRLCLLQQHAHLHKGAL